MTLARTALRLQGVLTLLADPVIDGLCQGRVYDSRIGDFDEREPVPAIILTTDDDNAEAWSRNNGGPPFDHVVDLVLEIGMMMRQSIEHPVHGAVEAIGPPETDAELEAYLDLLEERAVAALGYGETAEARLLREAVTRRITKNRSLRFANEQGVKFAVRLVTLTVHLKCDDGSDEAWASGAPPAPPSGPYANLPEPLRSVARSMPEGYSGRTLCDLIAARLPPVATEAGSVLTGIDMVIAPQRLASGLAPSRSDDLAAGRVITAAVPLPAP